MWYPLKTKWKQFRCRHIYGLELVGPYVNRAWMKTCPKCEKQIQIQVVV